MSSPILNHILLNTYLQGAELLINTFREFELFSTKASDYRVVDGKTCKRSLKILLLSTLAISLLSSPI